MNFPQSGPISVRTPLRPYALFGRACYAKEQDAGGEGEGNKGKPEGADEPLTLSKSELQKLIDDNRKEAEQAAENKLAAKAQKDREAAEAEEAKKRGEFEKVAEKERARADAAEAKANNLERSIKLRDHLAEKHPEYSANAKYILPMIPTDVEGDDLDKAIANAAKQYVDDNPRTPKNPGGAPPAGGNRVPAGARLAPGRNQRPLPSAGVARSIF